MTVCQSTNAEDKPEKSRAKRHRDNQKAKKRTPGSAASSDTSSSDTAHTHKRQDLAVGTQRQSPKHTESDNQCAEVRQSEEVVQPWAGTVRSHFGSSLQPPRFKRPPAGWGCPGRWPRRPRPAPPFGSRAHGTAAGRPRARRACSVPPLPWKGLAAIAAASDSAGASAPVRCPPPPPAAGPRGTSGGITQALRPRCVIPRPGARSPTRTRPRRRARHQQA